MLSAALHQNVQWHMWVYDFRRFTEMLLAAHDPKAPTVDPVAEWPTIGHYLIYEMFSAMHRWIQDANDLPSSQANIKLNNKRFDHENGNIPKSTIMTMVLCFKDVIIAHNISDKFKRYLLDIVLATYESTRVKNGMLQMLGYDEMMLNAITVGDYWKRDPDVPIYQETLLRLLPEIDLRLKPEAKSVRDAICEALAERG
jgi:hypothetical protein